VRRFDRHVTDVSLPGPKIKPPRNGPDFTGGRPRSFRSFARIGMNKV